jgi:hypothetical protein
MQITAMLINLQRQDLIGGYVYWGNVYSDTKLRFQDGARIHTSRVVEERRVKNGKYIITRNSVYFSPNQAILGAGLIKE